MKGVGGNTADLQVNIMASHLNGCEWAKSVSREAMHEEPVVIFGLGEETAQGLFIAFDHCAKCFGSNFGGHLENLSKPRGLWEQITMFEAAVCGPKALGLWR
jgi:hypothetical protein